MIWDKVLSSSPLNSVAGAVTSKGWDSNLRNEDSDQYEQDGPHKTKPIPKDGLKGAIQIGSRFGRFTVLGLVDGYNRTSSGLLWSVRCDCGTYTARRTKGLTKNKRADIVCCAHCKRSIEVRQGKGTVNIVSGEVDRQ